MVFPIRDRQKDRQRGHVLSYRMTAGDLRAEDDCTYARRVKHRRGGRRTMTSEQRCRETADRYGGKFTITHDRREGLAGAHWVNSKS